VRENIIALPSILRDIIEAKGCTIQQFSHINNSGKRYVKLNGKGFLTNKPQKRDRKSTLVLRPCHLDLQPALDALIIGTVLVKALDELDAAITATDAFIDGQPKLDDEDNDLEEIRKKLADSVRFFE